MKRSIVILALVTAFVFAFGSVAQATFRGWSPIRNADERADGILNHFITFPEARIEMTRNDAPGELQNTAHGGYVTTTTKCAVCHSAHRGAANTGQGTNIVWSGNNFTEVPIPGAVEGPVAGSTSGAVNMANARNQFFLTAGPATCETCHVSSGGQASRLLVEWGGPVPGYTGGGPHGSPARGCTMCHNSGIHGLGSGSQFNVMNVFMLGSTRGAIRGVMPSPAETRDEQIIREIAEQRVLRGGILDIPTGSNAAGQTFEDRPVGPAAVTPSPASTWWYNGERTLGPIGGLPPLSTGGNLGGVQFGAARSLATAYTCGEAGCHVATAMFNLNWGLGVERVDYQRAGTDLGWQITGMSNQGLVEVTGHVMPSIRATGGANGNACGPCHAGNVAGHPNASTNVGTTDLSRRAWGCDQCHDMVGVATNSTAWPHGNRNIEVYVWDEDGNQGIYTPSGGNLWMYGGNIARSADAPNPNANSTRTQNTMGPNPQNDDFADQTWVVLTGTGSGRYGLNTTGTSGTGLNEVGTGLMDGACLKCHVPLDAASLNSMNAVGADALRHAWGARSGQGTAQNPIWTGVLVDGSCRLFLYR